MEDINPIRILEIGTHFERSIGGAFATPNTIFLNPKECS